LHSVYRRKPRCTLIWIKKKQLHVLSHICMEMLIDVSLV
jgi:hypothetical protein